MAAKDNHKAFTFGFPNFNAVLERNALLYPDKIAITQLDRDGNAFENVTYRELTAMARNLASAMAGNFEKGDTCLILCPPGVDFAIALLACFFSGTIAVPVQPPRKKRKNERLHSVAADANPAFILLSKDIDDIIEEDHEGFKDLHDLPRIIINRDIQAGGNVILPELDLNDIALLQYTSGTTGKPNGTMISHGGILHNSEVIRQSFNHDEDLVVVTWLPPYHDMGLIGTLLQPLFTGGRNVIIDPYDFLREPFIWLEAITKYRGTTAGCPNFALDLLVERVNADRRRSIDLGSLKVFFCGSEPVRTASVKRFSRHFRDCGFREEMFLPCYGLAENTLMVCGIGQNDHPVYIRADREKLEKEKILEVTDEVDGMSFVSCGHTWLDDEVLIVDPGRHTRLEEGKVGEIWVRSKAHALGYWKQGRKSREVFQARLSDTDNGPFLRTGDLGFVHEGHIYVAGRIKDMIIIRGTNYFSTDIEDTVEHAHPALQPHTCAAFPVTSGNNEKLVVVQEVRRTALPTLDPEEVVGSIRMALASEHEIQVHAINLLSPGRICKTPSGKIQRGKCREMWEEGSMNSVYTWKEEHDPFGLHEILTDPGDPTPENIRQWLINWLSDKVKISAEDIDPEEPILSYGLDSLGAVELEREAREIFGIEIHPADFMENNTINTLARIGFESILKKTG